MSDLEILSAESVEENANLKELFENWRKHILHTSESSSWQRIEAISAAREQVSFPWMIENVTEHGKHLMKLLEALCGLIVDLDHEAPVLDGALDLLHILIPLLQPVYLSSDKMKNPKSWRDVMIKLGNLLKMDPVTTAREREVSLHVQSMLTDKPCYSFIIGNLLPLCIPQELVPIVSALLDTANGLPPGVLSAWANAYHLLFRNKTTSGLHRQSLDPPQVRRIPVWENYRNPPNEDVQLLMQILKLSNPSSSQSIEELHPIHHDTFFTVVHLLCTSQNYLASLSALGLKDAVFQVLKSYTEEAQKHAAPVCLQSRDDQYCKLHHRLRWTSSMNNFKRSGLVSEDDRSVLEDSQPEALHRLAIIGLWKLYNHDRNKPFTPEELKVVMDYMLLTELPNIAAFYLLALNLKSTNKIGCWLFAFTRFLSPDAQELLCQSMKDAAEVILIGMGEKIAGHVPSSFVAMLFGGFVSELSSTTASTLQEQLRQLGLDNNTALVGVMTALKLPKYRQTALNILVILASVMQTGDFVSTAYSKLERTLTPDACKTVTDHLGEPDLLFDVVSPSAVEFRQQMGFGNILNFIHSQTSI